ncbi:uncharacterized protein UDID_19371 [Ustilago sp. UG-2017a]|nr:uncharacterized protein UDID_19371 [Ustilago sp. UG-2017a]
MSKYDNGRDPTVLDLHYIGPPDLRSDRALLDRYLQQHQQDSNDVTRFSAWLKLWQLHPDLTSLISSIPLPTEHTLSRSSQGTVYVHHTAISHRLDNFSAALIKQDNRPDAGPEFGHMGQGGICNLDEAK